MRGGDVKTEALFSYVSCEARVPRDHPLRAIGKIVNKALAALSPKFEKLYAKLGRPSIPPEKLLCALLLQAFYSVRSERQLMEQLDYNLLVPLVCRAVAGRGGVGRHGTAIKRSRFLVNTATSPRSSWPRC